MVNFRYENNNIRITAKPNVNIGTIQVVPILITQSGIIIISNSNFFNNTINDGKKLSIYTHLYNLKILIYIIATAGCLLISQVSNFQLKNSVFRENIFKEEGNGVISIISSK